MSESAPRPFEGWCIIELMGHRKLGGLLSEEEVAGAKMLRIDIPHPNETDRFRATQFYGGAAVYCITPTTEEIARAVANAYVPAPVTPWEIRAIETSSLAAPDDEGGPY
jgi:hypothetical protein